ncbi:glycosyltransferase [Pararhizobium mangrovi]|uniref:Glycosyltransferase n=1 Tax=Pararhizobium mangrovi TaxID=2590452 RepID=A0A506U9U2_9HYPH|nr:glycosyltransferase [Pararhizobium mangrovi]TPW30640.1 glycosyltransferase [Pararhizobium mangrovi]
MLGMHRSGTSAITDFLRSCGLFVGTQDELTKPGTENPKGFFERYDARRICDTLLHSADADWWKAADFSTDRIPASTLTDTGTAIDALVSKLDAHGSWVLKEPRLCLLLPVFERYLRDPVAVVVYRNPLEVAYSLRHRNGIPVEAGLALWELYVTSLLRHSQNIPKVFVSYENMVREPTSTGNGLCSALERIGIHRLKLPPNNIVEAQYRHQFSNIDTFELMVSASQNRLWCYLNGETDEPAFDGPSEHCYAVLQHFEADYARLQHSKKTTPQIKYLREAQLENNLRLRQQDNRIQQLNQHLRQSEQKLTSQTLIAASEQYARQQAELNAKDAYTAAENYETQIRELKRSLQILKQDQESNAQKTRVLNKKSIQPATVQPQYRSDRRSKTIDLLDRLRSIFPSSVFYEALQTAITGTDNHETLELVRGALTEIDIKMIGRFSVHDGPLVSIIMPTHNRAGLLAEAVASVSDQTYGNFELIICDDASDDGTNDYLTKLTDARINVIRHSERKGAAAARNYALSLAKGNILAYLDSDNLWHPRFLELSVGRLLDMPGRQSVYAAYYDTIEKNRKTSIKRINVRSFNLESQISSPFIDLNSFVHRRDLYDMLGGFDEALARRQDFDLVSRYCWTQEPIQISHPLNLYRRLENIQQITNVEKQNTVPSTIISEKINRRYETGLAVNLPSWVQKVSVLSWDMNRNHFAKAYSVAEALSRSVEVELLSFSFFPEENYKPLEGKTPPFECKFFPGSEFPEFFSTMAKAMHSIEGDLIYAVKPRLPSFGLAMMANYHHGIPFMLECNDLETVVSSPKSRDRHTSLSLDELLGNHQESKNPYSLVWSQALDELVADVPVTLTHNDNLNRHYGNRSLFLRNVKNEKVYDPSLYDRDDVRKKYGLTSSDRVILFGGLVRKHKGIFELLKLLETLDDPRYKLLVVGNRQTPDLLKLIDSAAQNVILLPPQTPEEMAALNLAADLVILWLDPQVAASHFQSPYKMSDALAMGPAIIASPTGDQAKFAEHGIMSMVPYGNFELLVRKIEEIFSLSRDETDRRRRLNRQFFLREFSYNAVAPAVALGSTGMAYKDQTYPISERFAAFFGDFAKSHRSI